MAVALGFAKFALAGAPAVASFPLHGCVDIAGNGRPPAALVELLPASPPGFERAAAAAARTGREGCFELAIPRPGLWTLRVSAGGFVPLESPALPLVEESELTTAELAPDVGLSVQVRDPNGRPLAGARISAVPAAEPDDNAAWVPAPRAAMSGPQGVALLPRLAGETLRLWATTAGYLPGEALVKPEEGKAHLTLVPGTARSLRAVDPAGRPVGGALVRWGPSRVPLGLTGEDGSFTAAARQGQATPIQLSTREGLAGESDLSLAPDAEAPPVPLRPAPRLSGRVLEVRTGRPLAGALVWIPGQPWQSSLTQGDGRYSLPSPAAASQRPKVEAHAAGYLPAQGEARGKAGAWEGPALALEPSRVIRGRVVDTGGRPVDRAEIRIHSVASPPAPFRTAPADVDLQRFARQGRFSSGPVPPQLAYQLTASAPSFARATLTLEGLEPGAKNPEVTLILERGRTAAGRVVDPHQHPIAGARILLLPARGDSVTDPWAMAARIEDSLEAVTGAEGRFEIRQIPVGARDLLIEAPGFARAQELGIAFPAAAGSQELGTFVLQPGVAVRGRVVDGAGRPLPEVSVAAAPSRAEAGPWAGPADPALTDGQGRFELPDLRPGDRLDLTARKTGYAPSRLRGLRAPTGEPVTLVLERAAAISGRVVDAEGHGVAEAWVQLDEARGEIASAGVPTFFEQSLHGATADAEGAFQFSAVAPGKILLRAHRDDYQPSAARTLEIQPGRSLEKVELVLERGAVITGRIARPDGLPVPGAHVRVREPGQRGVWTEFLFADSDGEGIYRLDGVPLRRQRVEAFDALGARVSREIEVRPGDNSLDLVLEPGRQVRGRVVDASGRPVAGARGTLRPTGSVTPDVARARSTFDGTFMFAGVAGGTYELTFEREGYAPAGGPGLLTVGSDDLEGLEVRLVPGVAISGRVLGVEPERWPEVEILATGPGGTQRPGRVFAEGRYEIPGAGAGDWQITARLGFHRQASAVTTILPEATEAHLDLDLSRGVTVHGRTTLDGQPLVGARIGLWKPGGPEAGAMPTDQDGRFTLPGIEPGHYVLAVTSARPAVFERREVDLDADRELLLDLQGMSLSGQVVDAADSAPVAGAVVALETAEGGSGPAATSDARGAFEIHATAGHFRLVARKEGYAVVERDVELGPDSLPAPIELRLEPARGLRLRVQLPSGLVPATVDVAVLDALGRSLVAGTFPTAGTGWIRLPSVPEGSWTLVVAADGTGSRTVAQVRSPGPPAEVGLPFASALVIEAPTGNDGAIITLTTTAGEKVRTVGPQGRIESSWSLASGHARIDRLAPGRYQVDVAMPGLPRKSLTVVLEAGAVARVSL